MRRHEIPLSNSSERDLFSRKAIMSCQVKDVIAFYFFCGSPVINGAQVISLFLPFPLRGLLLIMYSRENTRLAESTSPRGDIQVLSQRFYRCLETSRSSLKYERGSYWRKVSLTFEDLATKR